MKLRNVRLVAQKEYIRVIRKPSFWIATFVFPVFIGVVSFVSGYSAQQTENKIQEEVANAKHIEVIDESGLILPQLIQEPYVFSSNETESLTRLKDGDIDGVFVYPADVAESQTIQVYQSFTGLFAQGKFENVATALLNQSVILSVNDPEKVALLTGRITAQTTSYEEGEAVHIQLEQFIFPIVALVLYFMLVFLANNFLLMSVSEEKENRMIEIVLSIMRPVELITGKIIGMTGIAFTQLTALLLLGGLVFFYSSTKLPFDIDFSAIDWNVAQILISFFYLICGFLIMASVMVGVGAAMPTYRDAQSFSSVFVIASIFPIYFAALIVAEPNGLIAQITSYFPLTASLILLARNALGELGTFEIILSSILLVFYVIGGFYVANKLFELGSLEYNQKLSVQRIMGMWKKGR